MNPIFGKLFKNGAGKLLEGAGKVLDEIITTKEERDAAKLALEQEFNRFSEAMANAANKELETRLADIQSARQREVELAKSIGRDWMMYLVCMVGLAAFGFVLYTLVYLNIPEANRDLFIHAIGMVEGVAISIFTYYFGSSKGSADKTKLMKQ